MFPCCAAHRSHAAHTCHSPTDPSHPNATPHCSPGEMNDAAELLLCMYEKVMEAEGASGRATELAATFGLAVSCWGRWVLLWGRLEGRLGQGDVASHCLLPVKLL